MLRAEADLSSSDYERERERLAHLPRAERFEALIDFPARHMFKVIGRGDTLVQEVRAALCGLDLGQEVAFTERFSSGGRHLALTFEIEVSSGAQLDCIYLALEGIKSVSFLL